MNSALELLIERIRGEVIDLDMTVRRVQRSWSVVSRGLEDQDVYLDSVALNLHGFYSGLERLFTLVARTIDEATPSGDNWHRELLAQMACDVPDMRPAVISSRNAVRLGEFRRFRHLVRNVYASELLPERMTAMLTDLPELWVDLRAELLAFADFLEQAA